MTWSLGVEEQFYLISPPLVRLVSTQNLKSILIATLILTPLFRAALFLFWAEGRFAMYVWMPCRADSLAVGVLVALLWQEGKIQRWYVSYRSQFYLLIGGLALPIPFFIKWLFSPYLFWMGFLGYSWLALFFVCVLLLSLLEPHSLWSGILGWGFLREMGRLSYCIYLIHLLVLGMCHALILHSSPSIASARGIAVTLLAFGATYIFATCSWYFFEHPFLRLGHFCRYKFAPPDG